jgi:hypothetical protein
MRERIGDHLDLIAWNPHVGHDPEHVLAVLTGETARRRADVIALNEVRNMRGPLERWARRNGYRLFQEPVPKGVAGKPEHGSTAVLVDEERSDLGILGRRVVAMARWWKVFSHNTTRRPRRYERLRLRTWGGRWKSTFSHWPTNGFGGGNRVAFAESAARAAAALRLKRPGVIGLDVGDHNESVTRLRVWTRAIGAKVVGRGPDSCIATGPVELTKETRPKYGSDHHLMRYRATRTVSPRRRRRDRKD